MRGLGERTVWLVDWAESPSERGVVGIFASKEAAEEHLRSMGAVREEGEGDYWEGDNCSHAVLDYELQGVESGPADGPRRTGGET